MAERTRIVNGSEIERARSAVVGIDNRDAGVAQRGVDGKHTHSPNLRSPFTRSTPKAFEVNTESTNSRATVLLAHRGEGFAETDWRSETQANRVFGAGRSDDGDCCKRPFILGHDERSEPNRDARLARTGGSLAQFSGTERADRKSG